jgi:hypothetical protein
MPFTEEEARLFKEQMATEVLRQVDAQVEVRLAEAKETADRLAAQAIPAGAQAGAGFIKMPAFWTQDIETWFIMVETAFLIRNPPIVNDEVKARHVMFALPNTVIRKVKACNDAPVGQKYEAIKDRLIQAYARTEKEKHEEFLNLLSAGDLGDMCVADFVDLVDDLTGKSYDAIVRMVVLNALPNSVRTSLADKGNLSQKDFFKTAQTVLDAHKGESQVSVARTGGTVSALYKGNSGNSGGNRRSFGTDRSAPERSSFGSGSARLCPPHKKYGKDAFTCRGGSCSMAGAPLARAPTGGNRTSSSNRGRSNTGRSVNNLSAAAQRMHLEDEDDWQREEEDYERQSQNGRRQGNWPAGR